jgi:hypothetical protein
MIDDSIGSRSEMVRPSMAQHAQTAMVTPASSAWMTDRVRRARRHTSQSNPSSTCAVR